MGREALPADQRPRAEPVSLADADRKRVGGRSGLLLETKLHAPGVRKGWVERHNLVGRLVVARAKLVLINAPAGFGKTILAGQWRASTLESRPFAWVSLDPGDNDPVRLWRHVVSALERASPGSGMAGSAGALRVPVPDVAGAFLPLLVNELSGLTAPVVLVLDDYDTIKERNCRNQIGFLLRHLPPTAQIALLTRTGEGLPLGRIRAAGDVAEFGMEDLRFSAREAAEVVASVSQVNLSPADLAELIKRTEGWPAGLYLAALFLRGHRSPTGFIRQFTGGHRYIVDFLMEEVVGRQPPRIRDFLVRTAILDRFTAALCDAVAGSGNAGKIIEVLERENLFLVALDDERRWFRYHHLFAEMLQSLLARSEPDLLPVLHARASAWYRDNGSLDDAVGHALAADDADAAVRMIAEHWYGYVTAGGVATVSRWMRSVGAERIRSNPIAAHCAAWTAAYSGDCDSLRRWLPVLEAAKLDGPLPDGMRSLQFSAALLRATFGFASVAEQRESAALAAELEDDPASPWYAMARSALGWTLYLSGMAQQGEAPLREALLASASIPLARLMSLSGLTLVALDAGRVAQAEALGRAAREMTAAGQLSESPVSALAYVAAAAVYAGQGRLEEARQELVTALRKSVRWRDVKPWVTVEVQLRLAAALLKLGESGRAGALLDEADGLLKAAPEGAEALRSRLQRLGTRDAARRRTGKPARPLTEQERRILRLLGTRSRREIAAELYVSMNTVKTHTRMIYRKLGVSSGDEAITRARELRLLAVYLGLVAGSVTVRARPWHRLRRPGKRVVQSSWS